MESIDLKNSSDITVVGYPHPLRPERSVSYVSAGLALSDVLADEFTKAGIPKILWSNGHTFVDGVYVSEEEYETFYPAAGSVISYRSVPHGGGDKNPFKALLAIVVLAASSWAGGLFAGSLMSSVVTTGLTAIGMLAINALIPVKTAGTTTSNDKESSIYSLSGSTNAINKFGCIPVLLGRHRVTPPQAGLPYTELSGDDQYVMQLFCTGYTGYGIEIESEYRVGETDIADYDEFSIHRIESAVSGSVPQYYQNDVYEQSLAIELKSEDGWNTRVTEQAAQEFSIDLVAPNGLVKYSSETGNKQSRTVEFEARWRVLGTDSWNSIGGVNHQVAAKTLTTKIGLGSTANTVYVSAAGVLQITTGTVPTGAFKVVKFNYSPSSISNVTDLRSGDYTGLNYSFTSSDFGKQASISVSGGTCQLQALVFTAAQTKAIRRTISSGIVSDGYVFFEVQVRRVTADSTSTNVVDTFNWATLRSTNYRSPLANADPLDIISIRVKATGELTGTIDEFNFTAISVCKDWDSNSQTWVIRSTNNPASLFRYVLQHPANAKAKDDSKLNLSKLQDWHDFCSSKGLTYNRYVDYRSSVKDMLTEIAAAGLASIDKSDGLWGVVIERERDIVTQTFTPRNSWNFKASRSYPEMPHGWRVTFINEDENYQTDEVIVYADGRYADNSSLFEGIEFPGVTNVNQIIKLGRHHYADALLCREEYSFEVDFEHLVCTKGDRIKCAHYVTLWGVAQGRVKAVSVDNQTVTVDEPCQMAVGKSYSIRWRDNSGQSKIRPVTTDVNNNLMLYLDGTGEVPVKGDLFMFGETGLESVDLIVKQIKDRGENLTARIICKDYVPEVFDAVNKVLPDFKTSITLPYPISVILPAKPVLLQVRSLASINNGAIVKYLQVDFSAFNDSDQVQCFYRVVGTDLWYDVGRIDSSNGTISIYGDIEDNVGYDIRIRTIKSSLASDYVYTTCYYSLSSAIAIIAEWWSPNRTLFSAIANRGMVEFSWVTQNNITSHEIRYGGDSWETAEVLSTGINGNSWSWQATLGGSLVFWLKGIITDGYYTNASSKVQLTIVPPYISDLTPQVIDNNVLLTWINNPGSYDIDYIKVMRGLELESAILVGKLLSSFTTIFETVAGTYKYWVIPVDKSGLAGEAVGAYAVVNQPPDYVLHDARPLDFSSGSGSNYLIKDGSVILPINVSESVEEHFLDNSFTSPQDQIDGGFPFYIQPVPATAYYTETIDYGAVIPSTKITLALTRNNVVGNVAIVPTIETSEDAETWAVFNGVYECLSREFRYIRISLDLTTSDSGFTVITDSLLRLDVKIKTIEGTGEALSTDINGTVVDISGLFVDVRSINITPQGTVPITPVYDFLDVADPTEFKVYLFNSTTGERLSGPFSYNLRGV